MNEEERRKLIWIETQMKWYHETIGKAIQVRKNEYQKQRLKTEKGKEVQRKASARYSKTKKAKEAQRKKHAAYIKTKNGKERARKSFLKYYNSKKGREMSNERGAKRRSLGYIELNDPFPNSQGHHIDKNFVIYIPTKMHKSVWHNVFTGKNMEQINTMAVDFCYGD